MTNCIKKNLPILFTSLVLCLVSTYVFSAGICQNQSTAVPIPYSTPSDDFVNNGDGTVTHLATGLMWLQCSLGQEPFGQACSGNADSYNWQDALSQNNTSYAGYNNWRLPDIKELTSIIEQRCESPSVNESIFPNTPVGGFWTSSPDANQSKNAWFVSFGIGHVGSANKRFDVNYVRLVRNTQ